MTHHRAIIVSPNSVETIEIGRSTERAENYEIWIRNNYEVADIKTFGNINGADYVAMYYVNRRLGRRDGENKGPKQMLMDNLKRMREEPE